MDLQEQYLLEEKNRILQKYGCKTVDEALVYLEKKLANQEKSSNSGEKLVL